jgi:hypothetical protein
MSDPAKPVARVDVDYIQRVEKYQCKKAIRVGMFDPVLFQDLLEQVNEIDEHAEIELVVIPKNKMSDGTTSGLVVVICNGTEHFGLAGLTDPAPAGGSTK